MQIEERVVGDVTILDLKGKVTLGEGDEVLKDKINSLILQNRRSILKPSQCSMPISRPATATARLGAGAEPQAFSGALTYVSQPPARN